MYDLNKVMLIGRLTKEPEVRTTQSGTKVVSFTVAMTMSKNKETGEQRSEYIDCVAWEGLAEIVEKYVTKGTQVYVEGSIQTRSWEGTEGKKNYKTEVLAKDLKILTPKASQNDGMSYNNSSSPSQPSQNRTSASKQTQDEKSTNSFPADDLPDIDLDEIQTPF